jgi:hypothetical protein
MQVLWRSIDEGELPAVAWVSIHEPDDPPPVVEAGCGIHFVDDDWRSIVEIPTDERRKTRDARRAPRREWRSMAAKAAAVMFSLLGHGLLALVLSLLIVLASSPPDDVIVIETPTRVAPEVAFVPPPELPEPDLRALAATPVVDIPEQKPDAPLHEEAASAEDAAPKSESPSRAWSPTPDMKHRPSTAKLDRVGTGGGAPRPSPRGGPFGGRGSGKLDLAKECGGGQATEDAVLEALKYLARHQNDDGSWPVHMAGACCTGGGIETRSPYVVAATGLAVLAFLGAGYGPESRDEHEGRRFGDVVRKGGEWLVKAQDEKGGVVGPRGSANMYMQAIATMALCELAGMARNRDPWRGPAEKAVKYTLDAQNVEGEYPSGWRYTPRCGMSDTTVTGWCMMALKSAELAGIDFPKTAYTGVDRWIERCTEKDYYAVSYTPNGHVTGITCAVGVLCRIWLKPDPTDARITVGTQTFLKHAGEGVKDPYLLYQGSLMLFQQDGPRGDLWRKWNEGMTSHLLGSQCGRDAGCKRGSWEVSGYASTGGRAFVTAMNALTLEVYYRYPRAMMGK